MKKVNEQYEVVFILGLMLLFVISFLWMCVDGLCTPDWLLTNIIIACVGEILVCYVLVRHIMRAAKKLKGFCIKMLYEKILVLSIFGISFGAVWLLSAFRVFLSKYKSIGEFSEFGFACNIIGIASIFFIWMYIEIYKVIKRI